MNWYFLTFHCYGDFTAALSKPRCVGDCACVRSIVRDRQTCEHQRGFIFILNQLVVFIPPETTNNAYIHNNNRYVMISVDLFYYTTSNNMETPIINMSNHLYEELSYIYLYIIQSIVSVLTGSSQRLMVFLPQPGSQT